MSKLYDVPKSSGSSAKSPMNSSRFYIVMITETVTLMSHSTQLISFFSEKKMVAQMPFSAQYIYVLYSA